MHTENPTDSTECFKCKTPRASMPPRQSRSTTRSAGSSSPKVVLKPKVEQPKQEIVLKPKDQQNPERRVHPREPTMKPATFDEYIEFVRSQGFPSKDEAIDYAEKMWKQSQVHASSDATGEGSQ